MRGVGLLPLAAFLAASGRAIAGAQQALGGWERPDPTFGITSLLMRMPIRIDEALRIGAAHRSRARLSFTFRSEEGRCR